jgi:hypothetical protein
MTFDQMARNMGTPSGAAMVKQMEVKIQLTNGQQHVETVNANDLAAYRGVAAVRSLAGSTQAVTWLENMKAEQRRDGRVEVIRG